MKVITTGLLNRFWTKGIKPWLDKRIKSYADLMVTTASGYTPDALAVKEGFTELNGKLSSKLDSSKVLLSTTPQMWFSIYNENLDDYDIDFRRNETTIIKFRFHITNSNVDVYETRDNGASWTQRRSGNNYIQ